MPHKPRGVPSIYYLLRLCIGVIGIQMHYHTFCNQGVVCYLKHFCNDIPLVVRAVSELAKIFMYVRLFLRGHTYSPLIRLW